MLEAKARGLTGSKYEIFNNGQSLGQLKVKTIRTGATWQVGQHHYEIKRDPQHKRGLAFIRDGTQIG